MLITQSRTKEQLRSKGGFSLTEMLTTVLIMSIVLAGITAGVTTAVRVYNKIKLTANAQTLMSTAVTAINMDFRSASNIGTENNPDTKCPSFYSGNRGYTMQFVPGTGRNAGNICVHNMAEQSSSETPAKDLPVVTSKTKTDDLSLSMSNVSFGNGYFTYTITVSAAEGGANTMSPLTRTINVRPVD